MPGARVHRSISDDWVLLTNAHVISDDPAEQQSDPPALAPDEARIVFEAGEVIAADGQAVDAETEYEVERVIFSSPRTEFDCTVVTLSRNVDFKKPFDIAKRLPLVGKNQRVYVIGHPKGGGLAFSIDDNLLLDHEIPKIHYRAPTEGGSSGSPVFNQNWDLIALHHAGGMDMKKLNGKPGTYPANEGISFQSILRAVERKLG
jgi:V8-like Glu-specific endopeptidase